jgi:hypothetical protein
MNKERITVWRDLPYGCTFSIARHLDALRLVDYKLKTLRQHFVASRRLLTDLRTLRRYLLNERTPEGTPDQSASVEPTVSSGLV